MESIAIDICSKRFRISLKSFISSDEIVPSTVISINRSFGFTVNNDVFAANSWYFRNALVCANYNNLQKGIHATNEYLEEFFENLLLGAQHELKTAISMRSTKPMLRSKVQRRKRQSAIIALWTARWKSWLCFAWLRRIRRLHRKILPQQSANRSARSRRAQLRFKKKAIFAAKAASETAIGKCRSSSRKLENQFCDKLLLWQAAFAAVFPKPRLRKCVFQWAHVENNVVFWGNQPENGVKNRIFSHCFPACVISLRIRSGSLSGTSALRTGLCRFRCTRCFASSDFGPTCKPEYKNYWCAREMLRLDSGLNWHINNLEKQKTSRNMNTLPAHPLGPNLLKILDFLTSIFRLEKRTVCFSWQLVLLLRSPTPNREPIFSSEPKEDNKCQKA